MNVFKKIYRNLTGAASSDDGIIHLSEKIAPAPNAMTISTVYRCVNVISDSVASLPLLLYKRNGEKLVRVTKSNPLAMMLNEQPEERMSRATLLKMLVSSKLLRGNGYAVIDRDGAVPQLVYVESNRVAPMVQRDKNGTPYLYYNIVGYPRQMQADEVLHVMNYSEDGLVGESTLTHAAKALRIAGSADDQVSNLFADGGQPSGILSTPSMLTKDQKNESYKAWNDRIINSNHGVMILDRDWKYQPITITPADQQLLESREFSVVEICRFFDVNPVKCFDLSHSSYSTVEATELEFLTNTLAPILAAIEQEINRKLFIGADKGKYEVKFDTSVLLRADKTSQANYYRTLVMCGIMTPNEVREQLGLDAIEGGDSVYMQTNMADLNNLNVKQDDSRKVEPAN